MPLTKDISNMPSRTTTKTTTTTDKNKKATDNKKQKISDNKFFVKQNSETKAIADDKKNERPHSKESSSSIAGNVGRGRGRKPLAPTPPKRPILLRG